MDSSIVIEGWTASEIEEAMSLVSSINNSGNKTTGGDDDDHKKKHSSIVKELQDLFPWKTTHEILNLYIKLVWEISMAHSSINTSDAGNSMLHNVGHGNTLVKNGSFEGLKEKEDAMFNSEGLLFDYPLEETTEIGEQQTKEAQALEAALTIEQKKDGGFKGPDRSPSGAIEEGSLDYGRTQVVYFFIIFLSFIR
ncbi:hypothetical protein ABZP36_011713 [Zizania latifolia]